MDFLKSYQVHEVTKPWGRKKSFKKYKIKRVLPGQVGGTITELCSPFKGQKNGVLPSLNCVSLQHLKSTRDLYESTGVQDNAVEDFEI